MNEEPTEESFEDDIPFYLPGEGPGEKPENPILTAALDLVAEGISVIPLRARSKEPAFEVLPRGEDGKPTWKEYQERLPTEQEVRSWFSDPSLNFGVVCGKVSGNLVVLDFDSLEAAKKWGKIYGSLVAGALVVKTGRKKGGYHLWIRTDVPVPCKKCDGFDVKGEGGYVVGPGSTHPSGKKYKIVRGDMAKIPVIESDLLGFSDNGEPERKPQGWQDEILQDVPDGERHTRMTQLVGRWIGKGLSDAEILAAAAGATSTWRPPLPQKDIEATIKSLRGKEGRKPTPADPGEQRLEFTDVANAERFFREYGDQVRYCTLAKSWFHWNKKVWAKDDNQVIASWAKRTAKQLYEQAWNMNDAQIAKKAIACKSRTKIESMLALAKSEGQIPVRPNELDTDPWLWNCDNGTMDLRNIGFLNPHNQEQLITKISPVSFDDGAKCPQWDAFLLEIMSGDQTMVDFLRRMIGYCLTGDMRERKYFTLYGGGNNGKTVFLEVLVKIFGDYAATALPDTFLAKKSESIQHDIARLRNARLVCVAETRKGSSLDEELVKKWTGPDVISGRFFYSEAFDFEPVGKLIIRTNYKPIIKGHDAGIWGRSLFVEFGEQYEGEREDKKLKGKLLTELPGIFRWCLVGCAQWQSQGLDPPEKVLLDGASYREDSDDLADFFVDYLVQTPEAKILTPRIYELYRTWCETAGVKKPWNRNWFGRELSERGYRKGRDSSGRFWLGLGEK
ncbi:hypothetical protein ES705_09419 [subsurface metagenome]